MAPPKKQRPDVVGSKRVVNNVRFTSFSPVPPINQKNYYTEYLKRDDQAMILRHLAEDAKAVKAKEAEKNAIKHLQQQQQTQSQPSTTAASSLGGTPVATDAGDEEGPSQKEEEQLAGSKTVVIHWGSSNLRIGLASSTFPKVTANVVARFDSSGQDEMDLDQDDTHKIPPRSLQPDGEYFIDEDFAKSRDMIFADFRERLRFYKHRMLPNSHDLVATFNKRSTPETIPDHNDPNRVEWTEITDIKKERVFVGEKALKLSLDKHHKFRFRWPFKDGQPNEQDYESVEELFGDISTVLEYALKHELSLDLKDLKDYSVIMLIPDLYEKSTVISLIDMLFRDFDFSGVSILQESMAATFGAGISTACVIDIGAEKTSISCVEEGMILPDTRVNLKYGGDDLLMAFVKLLICGDFPYSEIDLSRPFDYLLAQQLKESYLTAEEGDLAIQAFQFYQRAPNQNTRKYAFRAYEERMLPVLGFFYPELFEFKKKLVHQNRFFHRSKDLYDNSENDPTSEAQIQISSYFPKRDGEIKSEEDGEKAKVEEDLIAEKVKSSNLPMTEVKQAKIPISGDETPASSSLAGTPQPEENGEATSSSSKGPNANGTGTSIRAAKIDPNTLPVAPLDHALIESIVQSGKGDESRPAKMYENILIVGGGAIIPGFQRLLEDRVGMWAPDAKITIMPVPREMDPKLLAWKGASVFTKLNISSEVRISAEEWDLLGSRCLQYKCLFVF